MLEYPNLDRTRREIRVLTFTGESADGLLNFTLETVSLHERPFIALSYTWGTATLVTHKRGKRLKRPQYDLTDDVPKIPVLVNGTFFFITRNLSEFLRSVKPTKLRSASLYIDQICISQNDILEQSHQVALMGQIYSTAIEVIAWMPSFGEPPPESLRILDDDLNLQSFLKRVDSWDWSNVDRTIPFPSSIGYEQLARDVIHSFKSVYWSRQWIVQEVLLARELTLQIAELSFDWQVLISLLNSCDRPHEVLDERPRTELRTSKRRKETPSLVFSAAALLSYKYEMTRLGVESDTNATHRANSIAWVLMQLSNRNCKHQRDKIFSLLSLTNLEIEPDYNKPLSVLFVEATTSGIVDLLKMAENGGSSTIGLAEEMQIFLMSALLACGFKISTPAVTLMVWQTLKKCGVSELDCTRLIKDIWWCRGYMSGFAIWWSSDEKFERHLIKLRSSWLMLRRQIVNLRLLFSKSLDSLKLPDVDHETERRTTIRKSYSKWIQLVDEVIETVISRTTTKFHSIDLVE